MEIGDSVICLDNEFIELGIVYPITVGKVYTILDKDSIFITIISDDNLRSPFSNKRFMLLSEHRLNVINNILK